MYIDKIWRVGLIICMISSINVKWITTCFFKSQFAFQFLSIARMNSQKIFLFICFITAVDFHRKNVNNIFCFISKQKQLLHPHPHSTQYQVNRKKAVLCNHIIDTKNA